MADEWRTEETPEGENGALETGTGQDVPSAGTGFSAASSEFGSTASSSAASAASSSAASHFPVSPASQNPEPFGGSYETPAGGFSSGTAAAGGTTPSGNAGAPPSGQGPAASGWNPVGAGYAPPPSTGAMPPPPGGPPNPAAAGLLGLIPGVGAMYNGQYAKGLVHLLIFAALVSLANNVSGIFGIMVAAWIFYQAFEAYHTARARLDGLPLPDPFGWNDIGERLGFGRNWPGSASRPAATPLGDWRPWGMPNTGSASTAPGAAPTPAGQPAGPGFGSAPEGQVPPSQPWSAPNTAASWYPPSNWAGYVPPSAFAGPPPSAYPGYVPGIAPGYPANYPPGYTPASAAPPSPASAPLPGQSLPYSPVSTGPAYPPGDPNLSQRRFPAGAIWLIGLGVLFLLGQWTPLLRLSHEWVPTILLAGLAVWIFARKMGWTGGSDAQRVAGIPEGLRLAGALRAPGLLLVVALLLGLQAAGVVPMSRSWPWLLIAFGGVLFAERILSRPGVVSSGAGDEPRKGSLL